MVVVLPAPLGPSRPYTDPARHLKRQVANRDMLLHTASRHCECRSRGQTWMGEKEGGRKSSGLVLQH